MIYSAQIAIIRVSRWHMTKLELPILMSRVTSESSALLDNRWIYGLWICRSIVGKGSAGVIRGIGMFQRWFSLPPANNYFRSQNRKWSFQRYHSERPLYRKAPRTALYRLKYHNNQFPFRNWTLNTSGVGTLSLWRAQIWSGKASFIPTKLAEFCLTNDRHNRIDHCKVYPSILEFLFRMIINIPSSLSSVVKWLSPVTPRLVESPSLTTNSTETPIGPPPAMAITTGQCSSRDLVTWSP